MPLHLTKIAFGCATLAVLEARLAARGREARLTTRYRPKREAELAGGSLYWIIGHQLVARSPILQFAEADGGRTDIVIEARAVPVLPQPRRAHQGWRYLEADAAPRDLNDGEETGDLLPRRLAGKLAELGLL